MARSRQGTAAYWRRRTHEILEEGPVAKVKLRTHLPMSFHGWWEAA